MSRKILSLLALVACASQKQSDTGDAWVNLTPPGRSPAGAGPQTPFAPGKPSHSTATQPTPEPAKPNQPVNAAKDAAQEAMSKCSLSLDQIPVGRNYSVAQLLSAASNRQQFFAGYYDYYTTESNDRALLAPWFGREQSKTGTEIFRASSSSRAYSRALQYLSGPQSNELGNVSLNQLGLGKQFAAYLVAIMAVSVDPMCVDAVLEIAKRALLDPDFAGLDNKRDGIKQQVHNKEQELAWAELDELRTLLKGAAEAMRDRKVGDRYRELDNKREAIKQQIHDNEQALVLAEQQNEGIQKRLDKELSLAAIDLRDKLKEFSDCRTLVSVESLRALPVVDEKSILMGLVNRCRQALDKRLSDLNDDELRQRSLASSLIDNRQNPDEPSDQELEINSKLAVLQEKVRKIQGFIELIDSKSDERSISSKLAKIDDILNRQKSTAAGDNLEPFKMKRKQLYADLELQNTPWLTYGFMGGFGFVKPLGVRR